VSEKGFYQGWQKHFLYQHQAGVVRYQLLVYPYLVADAHELSPCLPSGIKKDNIGYATSVQTILNAMNLKLSNNTNSVYSSNGRYDY